MRQTIILSLGLALLMVGPLSCKRFNDLDVPATPQPTVEQCSKAYRNIILLRPSPDGEGSWWVAEAPFKDLCKDWPVAVVDCLGTTKRDEGLSRCIMVMPEGGEMTEQEAPDAADEVELPGKPEELDSSPSRRRRPQTIRLRDL